MDIVSLKADISGQEKVITQLEQELHSLQSAQKIETGVDAGGSSNNKCLMEDFSEKEVEKLRLANDKLRYRIHILEAATAEELSQAKGAEKWNIQI